MSATHPNSLIKETSPYLLQHAYNPVDWKPWGPEAFQEAAEKNKLVLISIGYSACHWCHVMEKESFEDEEIAEIMNEYFVCVKVDREERPDVDNLYMTAVQLMTGHGGWPLNCFTLPDGRAVYGGTYFPKKQWQNVLLNLAKIHKQEPEKMHDYAKNLTQGIQQIELISTRDIEETENFSDSLISGVEKWKTIFDSEHGGNNRVPKFPMPNNYVFLLRYACLFQDTMVENHVQLTLNKMACGGIYDQLHGGFARYSTDGVWKLPHFEKMLYDNAQLVSLYAEAYRYTKNTLYKQVAEETLRFMEKEWIGENPCFFSALDADSEGEEGKYYVWTKEEIREILSSEADLFFDYYSVNDKGYWEDGNYILMRHENPAEISLKYGISIEELNERIEKSKEKLRSGTSERIKPALDNKMIASWNSLAIKAYCDAWLAFGNDEYKKRAIIHIDFLLTHFGINSKDGMSRLYPKFIPAFLDDYAFTIQALLEVFGITGKEYYLNQATKLCDYVVQKFSHPDEVLFYYTNKDYHSLVCRQSETSDNVIPSSNSQMAINLFLLGHYMGEPSYIKRAENMLKLFVSEIAKNPYSYSNWGMLTLFLAKPFYELAIVGKDVDEKLKELGKHYLTNSILAVSREESNVSLLKNRYREGKTLIYVCRNNTCLKPVEDVKAALKQIEYT